MMMQLDVAQQRRRALVMGACWLSYTMVYLVRYNLSVALPAIEAELGISRAQLGLLASVFLWVYGSGQLVNGYLGDRASAKRFIFLGLYAAALANAVFSVARSFWLMALCWAVNGWFQSMLWGPISKTVANWYPPGKSGAAMVMVSTSTAVGGLLATLLSGAVASRGDWRGVFLVPALIVAVYLVAHLIVFQDRPGAPLMAAEPSERQRADRLSMRALVARRDVLLVTVACFCQGIVRDGIALWATMFFMEAYGLEVKRAVLYIMLIPAVNFLGVLGIGKLYARHPLRLERLAALTFLAGALATGVLCFAWHLGAVLAMALLALASGAMNAANTLLLGVFPLRFAGEGRVSGIAGYLEFCAYLAAGCTAVLSGWLLDGAGWQGIIVLWMGMALLGCVALVLAERRR